MDHSGPKKLKESVQCILHSFFFLFLVKDQEEISDFGKIGNQEECRNFGEVRNSEENKHFTETVSFKEVDNVKTMSTQSSIQKFEAQAKRHEQATLDAWCKAAEATEKKEKKLAKKEARDRKKRDEKLRKGHREEPNNDNKGLKSEATNVSSYPFYQQVMNRLSAEFIISMKEEKDSSLYDKFIEKVIQHTGAVDTSVWDVSVEDMIQTIKDKDCRCITDTGDSNSDEDDDDNDVIGPIACFAEKGAGLVARSNGHRVYCGTGY